MEPICNNCGRHLTKNEIEYGKCDQCHFSLIYKPLKNIDFNNKRWSEHDYKDELEDRGEILFEGTQQVIEIEINPNLKFNCYYCDRNLRWVDQKIVHKPVFDFDNQYWINTYSTICPYCDKLIGITKK